MEEFKKVEAVESVEKSAQELEQEVLEKSTDAPVEEKTTIVDLSRQEEVKEPVVEDKPKVEEKKEEEIHSHEPTEDDVLSYIRNKTGREVNGWDDLVETKEVKVEIEKELDPEVSQYLKYKEETGRGLGDYVKLNRDFDSESEDAILAEFYSLESPHLSSDDIEFKLNRDFKFDEDVDEEYEIREKKIAKKEKVAEAKNFFAEQQEKYRAPLGSKDGSISAEDREWLNQRQERVKQKEEAAQKAEQLKSSFSKKTTDLFSDKFEGFKYKVGDEDFNYKVNDVEKTRDTQMDAMNFINKHLDENGELKDPERYHRALNAAMDPEGLVKWAMDLGASRAIEKGIKEAKGIDMSASKAGGRVTTDKPRVESVTPQGRSGRLTIKSRK